ncbi:hypothetical protein EJC49_13255 [Aquibium carbonis]|uniref:Uncharacterized protein n=1 Tax=Aquibium carbonis TaxID=2495581 RepID=A0A3S0G813_9HYPH|nr:hypothetical protein [Aquibium carbonis]RST85896.1 hypothetical protein EJC49_13255 [Aquibium carbonis]
MRFFFLVVLLAGLALGIGYPLAVSNVSGYEIGTFTLLDGDGERSAEVAIAPSEAPVRIRIAMQVAERFVPTRDVPVLRMTVRTGDQMILEQAVTFDGVDPEAGPAGSFLYKDDVATIDPVDGGDNYVFSVTRTVGGGNLSPSRVELVLNAGAFDLHPRAVPIGYILIMTGFVGFIAMVRRRRRLDRANPPPPRWGRGDREKE